MRSNARHFLGELIGTFILVFIGVGSIGLNFFTHSLSLVSIAAIWGGGLILAISLSRKWSNAHLNPAVTFASCFFYGFQWKQVPTYLLGQFTGAILASFALLLIYQIPLASYAGDPFIASDYPVIGQTAVLFQSQFMMPFYVAAGIEAITTFALVFAVFFLVKRFPLHQPLFPLLMGMVLFGLILFAGPLTNASLNPARELGPLLVGYFGGWGSYVVPSWSIVFIVYVAAPVVGGIAGAGFSKLFNRTKTAPTAS